MIIEAKLSKYNGSAGAWYFVSTTRAQGAEIKAQRGVRPGFGSVRVTARIGRSTWATSLFPSKEGHFLLPVKAAVRKREGLDDGDFVRVECILV